MLFEEAVEIIKRDQPNKLIWYGIDYKNLFIFFVAVDNVFVPGDTSLATYSVDKLNKKVELFDYWRKLIFELDSDLGEAAENKMFVDITENQYLRTE